MVKAAGDLLIGLHFKLSPVLMESKGETWGNFVIRCMENVTEGLDAVKAAGDDVARKAAERQIEASLNLVQRFLNMVEDSGRKSKDNYTVPWTVTFTYSDGDVIKVVQLPENPTVGQLRYEAGLKIGFAPDKIRVQRKDRKSQLACDEWDDKPYEATGMPAGVATCMPCVRVMPETESWDVSAMSHWLAVRGLFLMVIGCVHSVICAGGPHLPQGRPV